MSVPVGHKKWGGRKKGTPNKIGTTVRQSVMDAFLALQNDPNANLITWGKRNPRDFYAIASKLIPTELVNAEGDSIPFIQIMLPPPLTNGNVKKLPSTNGTAKH